MGRASQNHAALLVPAVGGAQALNLNFVSGVLDSRVSVTRAGNTATAINSAGVIALVNANLPRFDYDPTTLACRGLLCEELRVNLLLNSQIDGTNLSTQSVAVAAVAHTVSFYGAGEVVLSGVHSATVTGTGAYPNRQTLTFTPTAGSLTLTVTGTVQFAQLEAGSFVTSFIPTAGASVSRDRDQPDMTGTNLTDWYNATEGTLLIYGNTTDDVNYPGYAAFGKVDYSTSFMQVLSLAGSTNAYFEATDAGVAQVAITVAANAKPQTNIIVAAYKANDFAASANGGAVQTDVSGTVPTVNIFRLGRLHGENNYLNGHLRQIVYWNTRLSDAMIQKVSA